MRKFELVILLVIFFFSTLFLLHIHAENKYMKIALIGNRILSQRSHEMTNIQSPETRQLAAQLQTTFIDMGATGFAAPQIFKPVRMMIIGVSAERAKKFGYPAEIPLTILINPKVEPLSSEVVMTWEGCYSIPRMIGLVPRYNHIRYSGTTPDGEVITREVTGFHAFIVQHEYDHLEGKLYIMRMKDLSQFGFVSEFKDRLPPAVLAEFVN